MQEHVPCLFCGKFPDFSRLSRWVGTLSAEGGIDAKGRASGEIGRRVYPSTLMPAFNDLANAENLSRYSRNQKHQWFNKFTKSWAILGRFDVSLFLAFYRCLLVAVFICRAELKGNLHTYLIYINIHWFTSYADSPMC